MAILAVVLERVGLRVSPEEFERLVIAAIEQVVPARVGDPARDLAPEQLHVLGQSGVDPVHRDPEVGGPQGPIARGIARYTAIVVTSLGVPEAARRLGVDESRVRQRIAARTVYAFKPGATWRLPAFQFADHGLVPGIDRVLPHLASGLSPVTVVAWFQRPSANLVDDEGHALTPLEWLLTGRPVEPVGEAARAVGIGG